MISSTSLPALSVPPVRDVRATERAAPANLGRVTASPSANGATPPSALSPRGSILNLSV